MALFKVNGRTIFLARVEEIKRVRQGTYQGKLDQGREFKIEGGRSRGGTRNEWFVECPSIFNAPVFCKSLRDGLRLLDNT